MFGFSRTKRLSPRSKITGQARLLAKSGDEAPNKEEVCSIYDICIDGCSIASSCELNFDTEYELFVNLYPKLEFKVRCRVLWREISEGVKTFGLKFVKLDLENKLKLQQMVLGNIGA